MRTIKSCLLLHAIDWRGVLVSWGSRLLKMMVTRRLLLHQLLRGFALVQFEAIDKFAVWSLCEIVFQLRLLTFSSLMESMLRRRRLSQHIDIGLATWARGHKLRMVSIYLLLLLWTRIYDMARLDDFFKSVPNSTLTLIDLHTGRLLVRLTLQLQLLLFGFSWVLESNRCHRCILHNEVILQKTRLTLELLRCCILLLVMLWWLCWLFLVLRCPSFVDLCVACLHLARRGSCRTRISTKTIGGCGLPSATWCMLLRSWWRLCETSWILIVRVACWIIIVRPTSLWWIWSKSICLRQMLLVGTASCRMVMVLGVVGSFAWWRWSVHFRKDLRTSAISIIGDSRRALVSCSACSCLWWVLSVTVSRRRRTFFSATWVMVLVTGRFLWCWTFVVRGTVWPFLCQHTCI